MMMKLIQKDFLKGSREFEIVDDTIFVRIKSLLKEEKITIDLANLEPEPVINGSELEFFSRFKGRSVLSLIVNKPNEKEFNAFVDTLKQKISREDSVELVSPQTAKSALDRNIYDEPPDFDEPREKSVFQPVNVERLDVDISMLKTYLEEKDYKPLVDALEILKTEPHNEAAFQRVKDVFNDMGIHQGAVLTYATYLKVLLSESVWT